MEAKRAIPVPAEKALKSFYSFLTSVKEDLVGGSIGSRSMQDQSSKNREKRSKMLEQLKSIAEVLPKQMDLSDPTNLREQELVELVRSSEGDISKDYMSAQARWVDLLLDKVSDILDSTQYVNLEKLTALMEKNDAAGSAMEGKDVILLMGSPGSGKTTIMHYLAGTSFREISKEGTSYFKPVDVLHPDLVNMKVSCGGKDVITRHLQVTRVKLDSGTIAICDSPSFGDHESIEEVIANSLGLVRAIQKAKTVRPVLVLSRDEIGFRDQFNAYPQILSILVRMLGTDSNVNLEPFNFVFTKYDAKQVDCLRKQFSLFLKDDAEAGRNGKNEANKQAIIKHLIKQTDPDANIIVPTKGDPIEFLQKMMGNASFVECPEEFFVPNLSDSILSTMKRQLKFALLDLRDALSKNDNSTGIHRMQQMSKLANLLPEAGIYARHGFKAFKEIINQMVEDEDEESYESNDDHEDYSFELRDTNSLGITDSRESVTSSESEQWSNLSSRVRKSSSKDLMASRHLTTVPEEAEEADKESDLPEGGVQAVQGSPASFLELAVQAQKHNHDLQLPESYDSADRSKSPVRHQEPSTTTSDEETVSHEEDFSSDYTEEQEDEEEEASQETQQQSDLPEEEQVYAEQYSSLLKEMTIKAVEEEDYLLAVQRMQEFMRLARSSPEHIRDHSHFKRCVELFLMFSAALRDCDYHRCLAQLEELIRMGESGVVEARKCSDCGVSIAIQHIVDLREQVVELTSKLHLIDDPDEFDRVSDALHVLRRKVDKSNMLMHACMRGSNDKGKSEAVLACISYGFKVARLGR